MRIALLAFGKLRTPGLREAADHYSKLISPWAELREVELKPLSVPDKSAATRKLIQDKEGELLLSKLGKLKHFYLLDETGKAQPTQGWANFVRSWQSEGISEIALCVGSSLGFSPAVRKASRGSLSLGPQTLPHELARVVLLEQIYRAWSVVKGHPYHNEGS
ncbi:MAG: 23S rRNA (pseudouridine(1915)-N(3))-methyltransferase RlmH [Oligoflexia bacterium]|nr:23S rRNA (pseudouridine(1915)-N(3))-methyltransferase RlmH [Oligoflexia bacterium]